MRLVLLLAVPLLPAACFFEPPAEAPRVILERTEAANRENRNKAIYFVYRENVSYDETDTLGNVLRRGDNSYEVTFLEGESFHRWIARDGMPLPPDLAAEEDKRMAEVEKYRRTTPIEERRKRYFEAEENRFRFDLRLILDHHDLTYAGERVVRGRKTWVIDTHPRPGAPRPRRKSEWTLSESYRLWIDQETLLPVQIEGIQLFGFFAALKGTVTVFHYQPVEGVWLVEAIESTAVRNSGIATYISTTRQTYSGYRRFQASSVLVFTDPP